MNELQKDKLRVLTADTNLLGALKYLFNETIGEARPTIGSEDDSVVGQKYRAYITAGQILNNAFIKLEQYRDSENTDSGENKAR